MFNFKKVKKLKEQLKRQEALTEIYKEQVEEEEVMLQQIFQYAPYFSKVPIGDGWSVYTGKISHFYRDIFRMWVSKVQKFIEDEVFANKVWAELEKGKPRVKKVK